MSQRWMNRRKRTFLTVARKDTRDRIEKDIIQSTNEQRLTRDELIDIQLLIEETLFRVCSREPDE